MGFWGYSIAITTLNFSLAFITLFIHIEPVNNQRPTLSGFFLGIYLWDKVSPSCTSTHEFFKPNCGVLYLPLLLLLRSGQIISDYLENLKILILS